MRAAVANGADAVYFGLSNFNARARAANFTLEELPRVMAFLHARNVRGFVTLNTLIFSDELPAVTAFVKAVAAAGVDAVIVQDLGLVRLVKRLAPTLAVHASTQMTLTEARGIAFVTALGVERVVLARELSLADIQKVTANTATPVEVFVHGALCVAYSGQCLTSEALGGRSANRGQCAQACRLPYEMIVDGEKRELGDRAYLLSPQDLAAFDLIDPLIDAGVISFKIEGRLKGGPYVAATTQTYRKAIDAKLAGRAFALPRREELELAQTFSRGLTPGFLDGVNHQTLVRGRFPKSRGVRIGKVVDHGHGPPGRGTTVVVELAERFDDPVKPGDGVLFDCGRPEDKEPAGRVWDVAAIPQRGPFGHVVLGFEAGVLDFAQIAINCDVYKTDDPALRKRLEHTYAQDRPPRHVTLTARLTGVLDGPLTLTLSDGTHEAAAAWPGPLERARKQPTSAGELREQVARLGDTPFELGELAVDLPPGVMVPRSVLNGLRRQAASGLAACRTANRTHSFAEGDAQAAVRSVLPSPSPLAGEGGGASPPGEGESDTHVELHPSPGSQSLATLSRKGRGEENARLTVLVRTLDQLDAVLAWKPAAVYCDFEDLRRYPDAVRRARAADVPAGLAPPRIWKPGEDGFQALVARAEPDLVLVRNLASISYYREKLPHAALVGDFSLNVANELTADVLVRAGLERLVPSYDLSWEQLASMVRRSPAGWYEPVIHQHMPMFHNEFCIFAAFLSTGKDHTDCGRPCDRHKVELRDRVGANFPVVADTGCRNTVFNSVAQSAAEYVGRMRELGLRTFRVDLLRENAEQAKQLLDRYARVIAGQDDGRETWRQLRALNQLGVTRGTLQVV